MMFAFRKKATSSTIVTPKSFLTASANPSLKLEAGMWFTNSPLRMSGSLWRWNTFLCPKDWEVEVQKDPRPLILLTVYYCFRLTLGPTRRELHFSYPRPPSTW